MRFIQEYIRELRIAGVQGQLYLSCLRRRTNKCHADDSFMFPFLCTFIKTIPKTTKPQSKYISCYIKKMDTIHNVAVVRSSQNMRYQS